MNTHNSFQMAIKEYSQKNDHEIVKRTIKYVLMGVVVAFVTYYFINNKLSIENVIMIGITASIVFAILDTVSPTVVIKPKVVV